MSLARPTAAPARSRAIGARRRFVLQRPLETPDGFGGRLVTYTDGPVVWGTMALIGQAERSRAERPESAATHRVRLAHREDVSGAMRLALGPRTFAIRAATDPDGGRRETILLVEEIRP